MKSLLEIIKLSTSFLLARGIETPKREAEEILADALGMDRLALYLNYDRPLNEAELVECRKKLARRAQREPSQYIRGWVDFYHCRFLVNPSVLIPRQETEILVGKIAEKLEKLDLQNKCLLDLCCGSGCIGISLKKRFPLLDITLIDISKEALSMAQENAKKNQTDVHFIESDLFSHCPNQFHFIVCNPPYISENELETLEPEVRSYEPIQALIAGKTGLEFYQRLAKDLPHHLYPNGSAWLEIGGTQGNPVLDLFKDSCWKSARVEKDWAGHDRFFSLELE